MTSRIPKFSLDTLAFHKSFGLCYTGKSVADDAHWLIYDITCQGRTLDHKVPEASLRRAGYWTWVWYKDPATQRRKMGKHQFWPVLAFVYTVVIGGTAVCVPYIIGGQSSVWIAQGILTAVVIIHWLAMWVNWMGKQM